MDDDKRRHAHADPFVGHFPRDLVGHEAQEQDGHGRIHDPFDPFVRFCSGHGSVLRVAF